MPEVGPCGTILLQLAVNNCVDDASRGAAAALIFLTMATSHLVPSRRLGHLVNPAAGKYSVYLFLAHDIYIPASAANGTRMQMSAEPTEMSGSAVLGDRQNAGY